MEFWAEALIGSVIALVGIVLLMVLLRLRAVENEIVQLRTVDAEIQESISDLRGKVAERIITTVELEGTLTDALAPINEKFAQQDMKMDEVRDLLLKLVHGG